MKKYSLILFIFLCGNNLFSQKDIFKVDFFGTVIRAIAREWQPGISYERVLSDEFSIQLAAEKGIYQRTEQSKGRGGNLNDIYDVKGWGFTPEVRFYPFTGKWQAPRGLFMSLSYRYLNLTEHYYNASIKFSNKGYSNTFGFNVGLKHGKGFSLEYLLGIGYQTGKWKDNEIRNSVPSDEVENFNQPFVLRINVNIGLGFNKRETEKK